MTSWDQKYAMKNAHWEQAKGHMRAMVAIDGAMHSGNHGMDPEKKNRFEIVSDAIETFIKDFEDNALNE